MTFNGYRILQAVTLIAVTAGPVVAAQPDGAIGVWIDQTGRGAVEVTNCGKNLCGRVVWLKDEKDVKGCGIQILGDVKPVAGGKWDGGWIYDPDEGAKYSVELTPLGADKLKVLGYSGSKFFSETMIWKRAPADLKKCGEARTVTAALPSELTTPSAQPASPETSNGPVAQTEAKADAPAENVPTSTSVDPVTVPSQPRKAGAKRDRECTVEFSSIQISFPCP
jgi:uncharacterized protein (DUF2147 family)